MMKRRSKPTIYRVRLDGRSKDERYRTDNSHARAYASLIAASERIFLLLPRSPVEETGESLFYLILNLFTCCLA